MEKQEAMVKVVKNGPYIVQGNIPLQDESIDGDELGRPRKWDKGKKYKTKETYSLCRCGKSNNMPFCDNAHLSQPFSGEETADNKPFLTKAKVFKGPTIDLLDDPKICVGARFCYRDGGTWKLTKESDDVSKKNKAIQQSCNCPSGRLVMVDKKDNAQIEPKLDKVISVVEDPSINVSGPLWLKGGIPVQSANGEVYEIRNRVTLCRCGESKNKPFCDGTHIPIKFHSAKKQ